MRRVCLDRSGLLAKNEKEIDKNIILAYPYYYEVLLRISLTHYSCVFVNM